MGFLGVLPVERGVLCDFPRVTRYFMRFPGGFPEGSGVPRGLALVRSCFTRYFLSKMGVHEVSWCFTRGKWGLM